MSVLVTVILAIISIMAPGFFLALALLKKTGMSLFEIAVIGFFFGIMFPTTMIWLEAYLIPISSVFAYSFSLYNVNVVILTIIGIALCLWQGDLTLGNLRPKMSAPQVKEERHVFEADFKKRIAELRQRMTAMKLDLALIKKHESEESDLAKKHQNELASLKNIGQEEKAKLAEMHAKEEQKLMEQHEREERAMLAGKPTSTGFKINYVYLILFAIMLFTFATRMLSIGIAPHFFEFDPYFDMINTQQILTYGQQLLYDHAAWPTAVNGSTIRRIQPIVPYLEAYWYNLAGANPSLNINTNLLSNVSSFYPPIAAALLVFAVFMFVNYEYGAYPALIGAGLVAVMPTLLTTFIAGEQLDEPWGIFAMFFFYATYLLAVKNMKETRYAILAGIAFVATFLGAHYYTVNAAVLAAYIIFQGVADVLRNKNTRDFYMMNAKVLAIIIVFYLLYFPYGATLTDKIPNLFGFIPVIIGFPLIALIFVVLFEYLPKIAKQRNIIKKADMMLYLAWLVVLVLLILVLTLFTPLGKPIQAYITLSEHYTTPSIPLFATVQEYAITGPNYNFGPSGFGIIGDSIAGVALIVWAVLIVFGYFMVRAIVKRDSTLSIMALAAVLPLTVAGMFEVKYLPHFGVAYIIAIAIIIGELLLLIKSRKENRVLLNAVYAIGILVVLLEALTLTGAFTGGQSCAQISQSGNGIGYTLYCNVVPNYWLSALSWMRVNIGPYGPRVLAWWDYGDWINWFGNTNAVIRGDNAVPQLDYQTAARYVLGPQDGYGPANLASFADSVQAKYVLFDDQLVPKWGALDFLACVDVNQTSLAFAEAQGKLYGEPITLGTSECETSHDPAEVLIPAQTNNVNNYCTFSGASSNVTALKAYITYGQTVVNQTYCAPASISSAAPITLLNSNGTKSNIVFLPTDEFYGGELEVQDQPYLSFLAIYEPTGPNDTIDDAPSQFYDSNYYKGFFFGNLTGFKLVYPAGYNGINYINNTGDGVMIFEVDNYTGSLPYVVPKPSYMDNNYTIPG